MEEKILNDPGVLEKLAPSDEFKKLTLEFERTIPNFDIKDKDGVVIARKIHDEVEKWENRFDGRVTDKEFELLQIMGIVTGALTLNVYDFQKGEQGGAVTTVNRERMHRRSIETQRDVLDIVRTNLDFEGKPTDALVRVMKLTTKLFELTLSETPDIVYEQGLQQYKRFWQGIMGMTTATMMFRSAGWDVSLGKVEWDLRANTDLIVTSPQGRVFAVDVTEKMVYRREEKIFDVVKLSPNPSLQEELKHDGFIKINLPPLLSQESETFYDSRLRAAGYPSQTSLDTFRREISSF